MSIKNLIVDPGTGKKASVVAINGENGLVVATHPLYNYTTVIRGFISDAYGSNLNQNAAAGGTPLKVHDGTDSVLWTASVVTGIKFTFNSTDQNHTAAGAKSILSNNAALNATFQIAKGSSQDLTNYVAFSFWVYVDKDWGPGDDFSVFGWDTATGLIVGTAVSIGSYFEPLNTGTWQKVVIPLVALGLVNGTIDAVRFIASARNVTGPKVYFDDIQFESNGAPVDFVIEPALGTWLYVDSIRMFFADAFDSTLASNSGPNLAYDQLLGEPSFTVGVIFRNISDGEVITSFTFKNLGELLERPKTIVSSGGDGTNTWMTVDINFADPIILKKINEDRISLTINDDLTGLLVFRCSAMCREHKRGVGEEK